VSDPAPSPPPPAAAPPLEKKHAVELGLLTLFAGILRILAAYLLGEGAPFGPDGTGAEAAVHLGGHLYPAHVELIRVAGSARTLSVVLGTATVPLLWLLGHRCRLSGAGAWFAATLPLAVYPSALSAGDAPALFVVVLGALVATFGSAGAVAGGVIAMGAVAVKPIVAPALLLLLLRPLSLLGAVLTVPVTAAYLRPLWGPRPGGGLLASWWPELGGSNPETPQDVAFIFTHGLQHAAAQDIWVGTWLVGAALLVAMFPQRKGAPDVGTGHRLAVIPLFFALVCIGGAFGSRVSPRYFAPVVVPALLWIGIAVPKVTAAVFLIPTLAVLTQVADYRHHMDRDADIPRLEPLEMPAVDARLLFDESSTRDATRMRNKAAELARELPQGATYEVSRRSHGREGELVWPLKVARPDVRIVVKD